MSTVSLPLAQRRRPPTCVEWLRLRSGALALAAIGTLALVAHPDVRAQTFPSQPIRLIVPFAPGGGVDVIGRTIGDQLAKQFGHTVIVENKTGAGGNIASAFVGAAAARMTGLACLGTLRGLIGDLDRVVRVVRVLGFINCAPGFNTPSLVMHGFSDLTVEVFGEIGRHTRSSIGVAELYADMPLEVEALFEVRD